jgi:hypothetical protein
MLLPRTRGEGKYLKRPTAKHKFSRVTKRGKSHHFDLAERNLKTLKKKVQVQNVIFSC